MKPQRKVRPTEDRFWEKVNKDTVSGCWEWTSSGRGHRGYGAFFTHFPGEGRKCHAAHRFSWSLSNGPIPAGLWVLHKCDNPPCVNPSHLFLGDRKDNMLDCAAKGRVKTVGQSRKTKCANGHEFTDANTKRNRLGHRSCRECSRLWSIKNRQLNGEKFNAKRREDRAIRARGDQNEQ